MNDTILLFLSNALTATAGWFVGKRKSNAETDNLVLLNLEKSMSIYQDLIQNLKEEIHQLNTKIQDLETKVDMLMEENRELKNKK
jgi:cell division protein FtsB